MPLLRLTTTPALEADAAASVARELVLLMQDILRKRADLTSVLVEAPAHGSWTIGAALEVNVTAGTNTAEEKSRFIAAAHATLLRHMPGLAPVCYVIVRDIPADAWGYDGETQAARAAARSA